MSTLQTDVPLINVPLATVDGRANPIWFQFFIQLWRRTGGAQGSSTGDLRLSDVDIDPDLVDADLRAVSGDLNEISMLVQTTAGDPDMPKLASVVNDINLSLQTLATGDAITPQQAGLLARILDLSLILEEAQDVAHKLRRAINDATVDNLVPLDPLRSMAYQDASNVKITGGSISGLTTNSATSITLTDDTTTNATMYPAFGTGAGTSALKISSTKLTWNPSTGLFSAPSVSAQLNGTLGLTTPAAAAVTTLSASGQITSTLATGTAPFSITSTTVVPNLNVSQLLGGTWAVPGAIGSTTPNTGVFTQLSIGGQTTGIADFRTSTGGVVVVGRTSNAAATSQPGAYAVYSPNASGTVLLWNQWRSVVANATAGSEASSIIFSTRVGGSFVDCVTIDSSGNLVNQKGVADLGYSYQTPATGFSITIGAGIRTLILDPAGTLASGTITMPAAPVDGQEIRIASSQTITALTVSPNAGQSIKNAPTALTVSTTGPQGYEFIYRSSNTTWYRLQ